MSAVVISGADAILTMDDERRELSRQDILLRDGVIAGIGDNLEATGEVIRAEGCVVTPGLVNTHHHLS